MIEERIKEIYAELNAFDDDFMKYSFLAELSAYIDPDQPELMTDEKLFKGCQSRVWMECRISENKFYLNATSDTLIIRGILYVMMELFNGLSPEEITARPVDFARECGIARHLTVSRVSGIRGIVDRIYRYCREYCDTGP